MRTVAFWFSIGNMFCSVNSVGKVAHSSFLSVLVEVGLIRFALFGITLTIVVIQGLGQPKWDSSFWRRDRVDERIVNDVRNGTGRIIDDPSEVGGWPELAAGTAPADTDHDGMANEWEVLYCFNPKDPADGPGDADGDGYTNVEEYLNGTEPTIGSICRGLFLPFIVKWQPIFQGTLPRWLSAH